MTYLFNGTTKRITLPTGMVTLDLIDLYSRWKDWVMLGNAECLIAMRSVGGDTPAIPLYLFLLNGWRIVPQSADHALAVTSGVLEVEGGGDPFVDPAGSYKVRIKLQTPGIAIGYLSDGSTGPTAGDIAAAVLASLNATFLPVDVRKVNAVTITGVGVEGNEWGPA